MNDQPYDYGVDAMSPKIGDNIKKSLIQAADRQQQLEIEIAHLTAELEKRTAALRELSENTIPQIMDGMFGVFDLGDGRKLEISEKIRASIAGDKAMPAVQWLDEHDFSSIVKRQFVIEFNRDDEAWAKKFEADLKKRKKPLNVKRKHTVHPQTLEAFVREQLGKGVDLPVATFGIYRQRLSKVTTEVADGEPKKRKASADKPDF